MKISATSSFIVTLSALLVVGLATEYKDCGSKLGTIKSITVSGCPENPPCPLKHSTNVTISMNFTANADIKDAETKVYGQIAGVKVPFPLDSKSCKYMKCPIAKGEERSFTMNLYVKSIYPKIQVIVFWELVAVNANGDDDDMITCFDVLGRIV